MIDDRFFTKAVEALSLAQLAEISGAELSDGADGALSVTSVAPLDSAGDGDVSFFDNAKYLDQFKQTKARACFVKPDYATDAPEGCVCLITPQPYMAYALAAQAFYPVNEKPGEGIHPSAVIAETATVGDGAMIEAGVVIRDHAKIGSNAYIEANAVIGHGVEIGDNCHIGANSVISHSIIGSNVRLAPGVKIGQPGFGFAIGTQGFVSVPQLGRVIVEDYADIGANTTIDRGAIKDTVIGQGTRIDNLVQLGHNVKTGQMCVLVAQTGIAGSTQLGDFVMTGGQSGLAGHLKIGSGVKIGAQSGVMRDISEAGEYMGSPSMPAKRFMRQVATLNRMTEPKKGKKD